jgi:putative two-component system response regulator
MGNSQAKQTILVVDDTPENIDILSGVLRKEYKIKAALDGQKALNIAQSSPHPSMILLDIMMPGIDGYEVCRQLKSNPLTRAIPVIFITAKNQDEDERIGLELGAVDYITKPFSPSIVEARVHTHLALYDQNLALEEQVKIRTKELLDTRLQIVRRLGRAAEFRDNETGLHVIRMSHYARFIAEAFDDNNVWSNLIFNAAPMHDIGKIGIPDNILLKQGKLNEQEWATMQKHPEFGAEIIGDHESDILMTAKEIALSHHEKWDGSGYPKHLKGEEIPISGRIIMIADVFDALTTERPYKKAWSVEDAVKLINEHSGSHFDPALVTLFNQVLPSIIEIKNKYAESSYSHNHN